MLQIKIYNANQIGGCFTLIKTSKATLLIDYGMALPGSDEKQESFDWGSEKVDAVFITHYHADHVGRILEIPEDVPIYMGETTRKVLLNIYERLSRIPTDDNRQNEYIKYASLLKSDRIKNVYANKRICDIADVIITPYSVDHSAYDAHMYLIEADGEVCLHTGDFRGHGHRGRKMPEVIKSYVRKNKRKVDYLIIEGTMVGNKRNGEIKTEYDLYKEACKLFSKNRYVFLVISSTNLDSLASFHNAATENKMYTYCYSDYLISQLRTFSNSAGRYSEYYKFKNVYKLDLKRKLYHSKWKTPKTQMQIMKEHGFLCIIKAEEKYHSIIEKFKEQNPIVIYSLWNGYLNPNHPAYIKEWDEFLKPYKKTGQLVKSHTSGHATSEMLVKIIEVVNPTKEILPMHTQDASGFELLNISEDLKRKIKVQK